MHTQESGEMPVVIASDQLSAHIPLGRRLKAGVAAGGVAILLVGCSSESAVDMQATADLTCDAAIDGRQLPSSLGVAKFEDNRAGDITACHYLSDLGVPVGVDTQLLETKEEVIQQYGFTVDGKFGGLALLASGAIDGEITSSGGTTTERSTLLTFMSTDGITEQTIVADSGKVKIVHAGETPKVKFRTPGVVLWEKSAQITDLFGLVRDPNLGSIWSADTAGKGTQFTNDKLIKELSNESGGPGSTDLVVEKLVSEIIVTLPVGQ